MESHLSKLKKLNFQFQKQNETHRSNNKIQEVGIKNNMQGAAGEWGHFTRT